MCCVDDPRYFCFGRLSLSARLPCKRGLARGHLQLCLPCADIHVQVKGELHAVDVVVDVDDDVDDGNGVVWCRTATL
eukprot:5453803-Amphidinium_carterae.1